MDQSKEDKIIELLETILLRIGKPAAVGLQTKSEEVNELLAALSKAQDEYTRVTPNRENPFFKSKYADIDAIISATRPAFVKHGLSFWQGTTIIKGETLLCSTIGHASGQWISSYTKINPPKDDVQSYGSTLSYQCRYAAAPLLGITISGDPADDDGNSTSSTKKDFSEYRLPAWQREKIESLLIGKQKVRDTVCRNLGINSIAEMKQKNYESTLNILKKANND